MKSRFFRRRGFFLLSESSVRYVGDRGSSWWRTESDVFEIIIGDNLVEPTEVRWSRGVAFAGEI